MLTSEMDAGARQRLERAVGLYANGVARALVRDEPGYVLSGLSGMTGPMPHEECDEGRYTLPAGRVCDPQVRQGRRKGDLYGGET